MKPYLATRDGVQVKLERSDLIAEMANVLHNAALVGLDLNDENEQAAIECLRACGRSWTWRMIAPVLDEALALAKQHIVTDCMVQA